MVALWKPFTAFQLIKVIQEKKLSNSMQSICFFYKLDEWMKTEHTINTTLSVLTKKSWLSKDISSFRQPDLVARPNSEMNRTTKYQ